MEPRASRHTSELRRVSFLKGLDNRSLTELAEACRIVELKKGEDLFSEGDPNRGMFLLLSGSVKVFRSILSGREQILTIESPGAVVAELPMLDGQPYPASCAALLDSRLLLLPRTAFESLLMRRPELAVGIIRILGERLRHLVMLIEELSLLEVPQRLAKYLLSISERRGPVFDLTLSNREIAGRLGTVREIVSRNLHRLEQQGAIRIDGRRIEILDEKALRTLVDEG